jgi:c-di-GMP-binding flagellar brake protein YcgR
MQATNKRKHPRVRVGVSGSVFLGSDPDTAIPCEVLDVSLGGAFIHCTAPISIGQEILVEIHFESNALLTGKVVHESNTDIKQLGKPEKSVVRWVRGSSHSGFGVEFLSLSPEKKEFLSKLVTYFANKK